DAVGLHVRRDSFDRVLRQSAVRSGVRFWDGLVRDVWIGDSVRATWVNGGTIETCRARYVLDCSGRAGTIARRGLRVTEARYRTFAVTAEWTSVEWDPNERAHTIVESYRDGWAWSVPLSATARQFTVMIDPEVRHQAVYARELAKTAALATRLAGAR